MFHVFSFQKLDLILSIACLKLSVIMHKWNYALLNVKTSHSSYKFICSFFCLLLFKATAHKEITCDKLDHWSNYFRNSSGSKELFKMSRRDTIIFTWNARKWRQDSEGKTLLYYHSNLSTLNCYFISTMWNVVFFLWLFTLMNKGSVFRGIPLPCI